MNPQAEQELQALRDRLQEIRIDKKWLREFRVNVTPTVSTALSGYSNFLVGQEQKTIAMGNRIKAEINKK